MKVLNRDFTKVEKALILVLSMLLLALTYFRFVYEPIEETIQRAEIERDELSTELTTLQATLTRMQQMHSEMDTVDVHKDRMASYNNFEGEVELLNDILTQARQYSINFERLTRKGDQIRRSFTLQFTTYSFEDAKDILRNLTSGEYRCLLDDMRFSTVEDKKTGHLLYSVIVTATFYETMVGGTPDAGLPSDAQNNGA